MHLIQPLIQLNQEQPERILLSDPELELNCRQVCEWVQTIGAQLSTICQPGANIAILQDASVTAIVSIYSVLSVNCCYVPINMQQPQARIQMQLKTADVTCALGVGPRPDFLAASIEWLDVSTIQPGSADLLTLQIIDSSALAAILFTSGSTAAPKAIALSHRAIIAFADWAGVTFAINPEDKIANLAPLHFDLSTFDIFTSLRFAAECHIVPRNLSLAPSKLAEWLAQKAITVWYTVPSMLNFMILKGNLEQHKLSLRTLLFAGEVFASKDLLKLISLLPGVNFYNLFGPTETNVCCYWKVNPQQVKVGQPIPIGIPACGNQIKIDSATNELLVQGPSLMSGYYSEQALNLPLHDQEWYPTGDRVTLAESGLLYWQGRIDRMIKYSGYRIEPAEIESALCEHPEVIDCAVIVDPEKYSGKPIACYSSYELLTEKQLMLHLRNRLPGYMLPAKLIAFKKLPRLANFKIDYQTLQQQQYEDTV